MHKILPESPEESNAHPPSPAAGGHDPTEPSPRSAIARDETSLLLQHSGLLEAQQMGNVGTLATGLAHDLNNLLTVILGSAELARSHAPADSPAAGHLQAIETSVRRAGELCRAMLACARTDEREAVPLDVNAVVQEVVTLLETSQLAFHRVHLDLADGLPPVTARPAQFRQLLLNLLINAAEACGARGGHIRVSTSRTRLDERSARQLRPQGLPPGDFLRLRIADDGCGMDESTREQIFTPFFSRKGSGRGLGLASLVEILHAHRGGIRVFSEVRRGTIVDVLLPLASHGAAAPADHGRPPAGSPSQAPRLSGSVLIADDEDTLRKSLASFLGTQGLTVHAVGDGDAALAFLLSHPDTQLALLDRVMPKQGGLEVLRRMRAEGLRMPVILMSGNPSQDSEECAAELAPLTAIAKPFSLVELLNLIARHLPAAK